MRILLTNDDGIYAPGLLALYEVFSKTAQVDVVAPAAVESGGSHAITIHHPVMWRSVDVHHRFRGTAVEGTPADCVKLALYSLLPQKPDLVISGLNAGLNTGIHVIYSGTVAAAIESGILGCPAIAVSLAIYPNMDFEKGARIAKAVIDEVTRHSLAAGQVVNINIPEPKPGWPRGVRVAPQSIRPMPEELEKRTDPNGREYYWLGGDYSILGDHSDTDRKALHDGYICVTPLQFDLTDSARLAEMRGWAWPNGDSLGSPTHP
ncbi:MAG TPA: 5'/3'-nucleotidase SurE [Phycisphaerae bacterium]|nr:5'/3'-nucleotidase SurE [Phycisphaerae bacterium]